MLFFETQCTADYREELCKNLEIAETYVDSHAKRAQERYVSRYILHTRDETFSVGESVLVLTPDSTSSKVFSRWKGQELYAKLCRKTVIWWS